MSYPFWQNQPQHKLSAILMTDILQPYERSLQMRRIKAKNTKPELTLRKALHRLGFRYRLHLEKLPGKPDLVFPRYKTVIFVHGCFWHRHEGCALARTPKSNKEFWIEKFEKNVARDAFVIMTLEKIGWRVLIVWECELRSVKKLAITCERLRKLIRTG